MKLNSSFKKPDIDKAITAEVARGFLYHKQGSFALAQPSKVVKTASSKGKRPAAAAASAQQGGGISHEVRQRVRAAMAKQAAADEEDEEDDEDDDQEDEGEEGDTDEALDSDDAFPQNAAQFEAQSKKQNKNTKKKTQQQPPQPPQLPHQQPPQKNRASASAAVGSGQRRGWEGSEMDALEAGVKKYGPGKWADIKTDPKFSGALKARTNVSAFTARSAGVLTSCSCAARSI